MRLCKANTVGLFAIALSTNAVANIQLPPEGTTFNFDLDPLVGTVETVTLNKYTGSDPLSTVKITVVWEFDNPSNGISNPVSGHTQTAIVNLGAGTAEANLWSTLAADIVGLGGAIDGSDLTQTDVQTLATNTAYQFDDHPYLGGEKFTPGGRIDIVISGTDVSFFDSTGTFDINLAIDGGWNVSEVGDGPIDIISDTALSVAGSVQYESVPEPSSLALMGLGGLAMMRRRRRG